MKRHPESPEQRRLRQDQERQFWAQRDRDPTYQPLTGGAAMRVPVRYG